MEELNKRGDRRGMHHNPNSLKNLENYRSQPHNNNAKKEYSVAPILREMANEIADDRFLEACDKGKGLTWRQATALRIWRDAVRGKYTELLERVDGRVTLPVSGEGGGAIPFTVVVQNAETKDLLAKIADRTNK